MRNRDPIQWQSDEDRNTGILAALILMAATMMLGFVFGLLIGSMFLG